MCKSPPKKSFNLQDCVSSQTFTPTCQYIYTDISVISVTFCNSASVDLIERRNAYFVKSAYKENARTRHTWMRKALFWLQNLIGVASEFHCSCIWDVEQVLWHWPWSELHVLVASLWTLAPMSNFSVHSWSQEENVQLAQKHLWIWNTYGVLLS